MGLQSPALVAQTATYIGNLALRFWREARAKLFNLGVVGRAPWVDETLVHKRLGRLHCP